MGVNKKISRFFGKEGAGKVGKRIDESQEIRYNIQ